MLEIDGLKIQRDAHVFSYDLSLPVNKLLTIQGRSGAGKSTLLDAIAGFIELLAGDIRWEGKSLVGLGVEQRPVSMLFQSHNLFEHLGVLPNIFLGLNNADVAARDKAVSAAARALEVSDLLGRMPNQLSGGQRQRVALLRTLLRPEPLVLLDEPFTGLDNHSRLLAADWVRQQVDQQQKTVLLVTHQDDDVERIADCNLQLEPLV